MEESIVVQKDTLYQADQQRIMELTDNVAGQAETWESPVLVIHDGVCTEERTRRARWRLAQDGAGTFLLLKESQTLKETKLQLENQNSNY